VLAAQITRVVEVEIDAALLDPDMAVVLFDVVEKAPEFLDHPRFGEHGHVFTSLFTKENVGFS
jgi:hypothetical protein